MEATATKSKKKKSKYVFANIPGVLGCVYYLTVNGKNRSLMCTSADDRYVILSDLDDGYSYKWYISHFSYMVRQHRWQDPSYTPPTEIKVERYNAPQKNDFAIRTRDYTSEEFEALIDNIDDVNF